MANLGQTLIDDAVSAGKRAQNWIAAQGGASGLAAEAQVVLNDLQKTIAALEANAPALISAGGATVSAGAALAAAVSSSNLPGAVVAVLALLKDAGADVALLKTVAAAI